MTVSDFVYLSTEQVLTLLMISILALTYVPVPGFLTYTEKLASGAPATVRLNNLSMGDSGFSKTGFYP